MRHSYGEGLCHFFALIRPRHLREWQLPGDRKQIVSRWSPRASSDPGPKPGNHTSKPLPLPGPQFAKIFFFARHVSGVSQDSQWHQWDQRVSPRRLHLPPTLSALASSPARAGAAALWGGPGPPQMGPHGSALSEDVCRRRGARGREEKGTGVGGEG